MTQTKCNSFAYILLFITIIVSILIKGVHAAPEDDKIAGIPGYP